MLLTSTRLQIGAGIVIAAALTLAQLVVVLLHHWPSSVTLWMLYFEYSKRVDAVFRLLQEGLAVDAVGFIVIIAAAAVMAGFALYARIRLLEALTFHGALGCALLILLDNLQLYRGQGLAGTHLDATPESLVTLALFAACAFILAAACWRIHRRYMKVIRSGDGRLGAARAAA